MPDTERIDALKYAMDYAEEDGREWHVRLRMVSGDLISGDIQATNYNCAIIMPRTPEDADPIYVDRDKIESVLLKLASNPKPAEPGHLWTRADEFAAKLEGWNVFEHDERGLEIQVIDSPDDGSKPKFDGDNPAEDYVKKRARQGSHLHSKALNICGVSF